MHTAAGTVWKGIPTPLDGVNNWPSIVLTGAVGLPHFLVDCTSTSRPSGVFVVSFTNAEAVCAYEETPYWFFAQEATRPGHILNMIIGTDLLAKIESLYPGSRYFHFLLCGGDMCAEVVALGYAIQEFRTLEKAEQALAAEICPSVPGHRLGLPNWQVPTDV
jgi:hypothetical protein